MAADNQAVLIGVDAGKTTLRVGAFASNFVLLEIERMHAQSPEEAVFSLSACLERFCRTFFVKAVGLSVFGPLITDPQESNYGAIVGSSEPAWCGINLPDLVTSITGRPVFFDFDVNAGALAERRLGAAASSEFAYLSVGTGIGGVHFRDNAGPGINCQMGHILIPRERDDFFAGSCRFHADCLQGLASGRALAQRYGVPASDLPEDHPAWDLEARYLARASVNLIYTTATRRIVMGSSIACVPGLVELASRYTEQYLNGFPQTLIGTVTAGNPLVVKGGLTPNSSLYGAAILGAERRGLEFTRVGNAGPI